MQVAFDFSPLHPFKAPMPPQFNSFSLFFSGHRSESPFGNAVTQRTVETPSTRPTDMGPPRRSMFPTLPGRDTFQRRETQVLGVITKTSPDAPPPGVMNGNTPLSYRDGLPERTRTWYAQAVHRIDLPTLQRRVDAQHIGILEEAADVAGNFTKAMVSASRIFNPARLDAFAQRASFLFDGKPTRANFNALYKMAHQELSHRDVHRFAKLYKGVEAFGPTAVDAPFGHKHGRMMRRLLAAHLVYNAVHKNLPDSFPDRARYDLALARQYTTNELGELSDNVGKVNPFVTPRRSRPLGEFQRGLVARSRRVADTLDEVWPQPNALKTTPDAFAQVAGDLTRVSRQALDTPNLAVCDLMRLNARKMLGRAEWFFMHPDAAYKAGKKALKSAEVVIEADLLQAVADRRRGRFGQTEDSTPRLSL